MSYYNTLNEEGEVLKESTQKAKTQTSVIFDLFRVNPDQSYTPFEVNYILSFKNYPITSVRRAMSDLTKEGKLEKTEKKEEGEYGKDNYCWRLKFNPTLF